MSNMSDGLQHVMRIEKENIRSNLIDTNKNIQKASNTEGENSFLHALQNFYNSK
jgi:hypothetical protein